jgi:prepilin-type processing-associated H-X9-DG protein
LGRELKVYKCPEDNFYTPEQRPFGALARPRSVGLNWFLGEQGAGRKAKSDLLMDIQIYTVYFKLADFRKLSSSQIINFIDKHPDSFEINSGGAFQRPFWSFPAWYELPASYHSRGCVMAFCDGHAEYKKWTVPQSVQPVLFKWGDANGLHEARTFFTSGESTNDLAWVYFHMGETVNRSLPF